MYMMTDEVAARMYDKYCQAVGGKAFNGDNLPKSEEFFNDPTKEKQANAWREVAKNEAWWNMYPMGMKG